MIISRQAWNEAEVMSRAGEMANKAGGSLLYLVLSGAHAYGTDTPESDLDIRGVYATPVVRMLEGFGTAKVLVSFEDDRFDIVLQPVHKFLKLCFDANPNILDWLFMPGDCILYAAACFYHVLNRRKEFVTTKLYPKFRGYAMSHFQKMGRGTTRDLGAKRKADIEKHGYSTKNAMHLIRLARMGGEAIETGEYNVRRPDAAELLAIRRGEWSEEHVRRVGTELVARMEAGLPNSPLPEAMPLTDVAEMAVKCAIA